MSKIDFRDPNTQVAGMIIVVSLAAAYVFFGTRILPFGYQPRAEAIAQLEQEYETTSADLMKAKQTASRLPQVRAEYEAISAQWEETKKLLPAEKEMAELLSQITVAGQRSKVDFLLFEPQPGIPRDIYTENPINLKIQGGYHSLGSFLGRVSNLPRIVNVKSVNLKSVKSTSDPELPDQVEAELQMTAYTLLSEQDRARVQQSQEQQSGSNQGNAAQPRRASRGH
jgi:type IV pilus assembly protein PilO